MPRSAADSTPIMESRNPTQISGDILTTGDLESAAAWLRRSLEIDPDQETVRAALARIEAGSPSGS